MDLKSILSNYGLSIVIAIIIVCFFIPMQVMIDYDSGVLDDVYILTPLLLFNWDHTGSDSGVSIRPPSDVLDPEILPSYYVGLGITIIMLIVAISFIVISMFINKFAQVDTKYIKIFRIVGFGALVFVFVSMIQLTLSMAASPLFYYDTPETFNFYAHAGFYSGLIALVSGGLMLKITDWEALS